MFDIYGSYIIFLVFFQIYKMQEELADVIKCEKCHNQIYAQAWDIHQVMCNPKSQIKQPKIKNKKSQTIFQKITSFFGDQKEIQQEIIPQEEQQVGIPCLECGESFPFSVYAQHQQECVGHQLTLCQSCNFKFPSFLFQEHLAVCQGKNNNKIQQIQQEEMDQQVTEQLESLIESLAITRISHQGLDNEKGLTTEQLNKLKARVILKKQDCPICYTPMINTKKIVQLNCSHFYHFQCASAWLKTSPLCPMCRKHALEK